MTAVNYSTIRSRFADYCNRVVNDDETVIVARKDEKNVVLISLAQYNALLKAAANAAYLSMLDRSFAQLESGQTVQKSLHELEGME